MLSYGAIPSPTCLSDQMKWLLKFQHQVALFCVSILNLFDEKGVCKATPATPYLVIINMGRRDLELEEEGGKGRGGCDQLKA